MLWRDQRYRVIGIGGLHGCTNVLASHVCWHTKRINESMNTQSDRMGSYPNMVSTICTTVLVSRNVRRPSQQGSVWTESMAVVSPTLRTEVTKISGDQIPKYLPMSKEKERVTQQIRVRLVTPYKLQASINTCYGNVSHQRQCKPITHSRIGLMEKDCPANT